VWIAIGAAIILAWSVYKSRTSGKADTSAQDTGTPASDVPQFVNQTYTTVQAPSVQDEQEPPEPPAPKGGPPPIHPPVWLPFPRPSTRPPGHPPVGHVPPIFNATYIVRKGDTMASVAKKFGITVTELSHANGYGTGAGLRTGEHLRVPEPKGKGAPLKAP
jgi:hypothetical protein